MHPDSYGYSPGSPSRRRFVQGLALAGVAGDAAAFARAAARDAMDAQFVAGVRFRFWRNG